MAFAPNSAALSAPLLGTPVNDPAFGGGASGHSATSASTAALKLGGPAGASLVPAANQATKQQPTKIAIRMIETMFRKLDSECRRTEAAAMSADQDSGRPAGKPATRLHITGGTQEVAPNRLPYR